MRLKPGHVILILLLPILFSAVFNEYHYEFSLVFSALLMIWHFGISMGAQHVTGLGKTIFTIVLICNFIYLISFQLAIGVVAHFKLTQMGSVLESDFLFWIAVMACLWNACHCAILLYLSGKIKALDYKFISILIGCIALPFYLYWGQKKANEILSISHFS